MTTPDSNDDGSEDRQVFTSRLKGRPLLDSNDLALGRIRDVVLLPAVGGDPPRALGLVVQIRRRRIFVSFGRISEIAADGAHLAGGTVDLTEFTRRPGVILGSELYGRRTEAGTVADVAIVPHERQRSGWDVSDIALRRDHMLRGHGPTIVPWNKCQELFQADPVADQLASLHEMQPADLATTFENLPPARRSQLAEALDDAELADLLEEMPEADQVRLLTSLGFERSRDVVQAMQPDDAADLLAEMPPEQRERLLTAMHSGRAADLRRLLHYDPATAGGLMTSDPLVFSPDRTVAEVLARIRDARISPVAAAQVYVCELPTTTPTGRYIGSVGFQRLLRRPPAAEIGHCVEASFFVRPDLSDRELAVRLATYNFVSVAVCDEEGRLVGAVTVDDVLDRILPEDWRKKGG
ncbi:MAG: CBS domain-containing protein [Streptosporangiaceae bacterium]